MLIVIAFTMAPASVLAPFQYVEIVSATILGYLVFNEFPCNYTMDRYFNHHWIRHLYLHAGTKTGKTVP